MSHTNHSLFRYHLHRFRYTELGELYASAGLRAFSLSLIGIFVPIYLYELGFSLTAISAYFLVWFITRIPFDLIAGILTARFGPKHVMSGSYLALITYLLCLISLDYSTWQFFLVAFLGGITTSTYFLPYNIDFSKIRSKDKSGHQLSMVSIIIASSSALGPLIGGLIAGNFGTTVLFLSAIAVLVAAVPLLLKTKETLPPQPLTFKGYPWKTLFKTGTRMSSMEADLLIVLIIWPLFVFLTLFRENPYLGVGIVTTVGLVFSIGTDYLIGRLVDSRGSSLVRRFSAVGASFIHLARGLVGSVWGVIGVNLTGEVSNAGIVISQTSRHYANADKLPRIAYITANEMFMSLFKAGFWLMILFISLLTSEVNTLKAGFLLGPLFLLPLVFARKPHHKRTGFRLPGLVSRV